MEKCREEFEKWAKTNGLQNKLGRCLYDCEYEDKDTQFAFIGFEGAFQHQQAKVEELEGRNKMLSDNVKEMGDKHIRDTDLINQQAEMLAELQKRVDALIQKYKDEDRELKLIDEWEQSTIYGRIAIELQQALKGEG